MVGKRENHVENLVVLPASQAGIKFFGDSILF